MSTQNIFQDQINLQTPDFLKKQTGADGLITMPEFNEDNSARTKSLGALFKQARLAKNLEPKDVANRLKVSPMIIQDIEKDALEKLGPPVFVRNHLKRYAQLVGLSEKEVIERYKTLGIDALPPLKVAHPVKAQTRTADLRWISYPLIAVVVIWLGWLGLERLTSHLALSGNISIPGFSDNNDNSAVTLPGQTAPPAGPDADTASTETVPLIDGENRFALPPAAADPVTTTISPLTRPDSAEHFTTSPSGLPEEDSVTPPGETNDAETNTADGLDTPAFPAAAESAVTGAVTPEPASSAPEVTALDENPESFHELIMQFNADCWVEVKDANGERLAYGVIKANEVRTLNGEMPFSVTLGNAGAAQIKLDGRTVDESVYLSNTRGGVARFVLEPPAPG